MNATRPLVVAAIFTVGTLLPWTDAAACATCYGAEGHPQTEGLNMAIITLLVTTYGLAGTMFGVGFYLWRKGRRVEPVPLDGDGPAFGAEEAIPHG